LSCVVVSGGAGRGLEGLEGLAPASRSPRICLPAPPIPYPPSLPRLPVLPSLPCLPRVPTPSSAFSPSPSSPSLTRRYTRTDAPHRTHQPKTHPRPAARGAHRRRRHRRQHPPDDGPRPVRDHHLSVLSVLSPPSLSFSLHEGRARCLTCGAGDVGSTLRLYAMLLCDSMMQALPGLLLASFPEIFPLRKDSRGGP
jgi:hypothetical protein